MPPDPFARLVALTPDQLRQKIERLEDRLAVLEQRHDVNHMYDFFVWIRDSTLHTAICQKLKEFDFEIADIRTFQFEMNGMVSLTLKDGTLIKFTM